MGYSYMQPIVAKTRAFNGAWLVIVTAGYNNPSGVGKIFFINAADGTLLQTMSTGFGDPADPSGLAQIAGYTKDFHNQLVEQIYGGDLYGNFWRFDVSDPNPANWTVVQMASLTDPSGVPQPVTTTPNIEVDAVNGIDRWVFVGTGRLLDATDLTNPSIANQIQTLYAIRDGTGITPIADRDPAAAAREHGAADRQDRTAWPAKPQFGWYDDLPAGQRIITPPQAAISLVAYAGTSPQTDPCLTGQPATLYVRDFSFGTSLLDGCRGQPDRGHLRSVRRGRDGYLLVPEQRQLRLERHARHPHRRHRGHHRRCDLLQGERQLPVRRRTACRGACKANRPRRTTATAACQPPVAAPPIRSGHFHGTVGRSRPDLRDRRHARFGHIAAMGAQSIAGLRVAVGASLVIHALVVASLRGLTPPHPAQDAGSPNNFAILQAVLAGPRMEVEPTEPAPLEAPTPRRCSCLPLQQPIETAPGAHAVRR